MFRQLSCMTNCSLRYELQALRMPNITWERCCKLVDILSQTRRLLRVFIELALTNSASALSTTLIGLRTFSWELILRPRPENPRYIRVIVRFGAIMCLAFNCTG